MKKRLSFFFRYLTTSRHFRLWRSRWLPPRVLAAVGVMAVFLVVLVWSASAETPPKVSDQRAGMSLKHGVVLIHQQMQATEEAPEAPNQPPTRTPLPAEYISNSGQTFGITLAAVLLVIIVVIGVLLFLPRRDET